MHILIITFVEGDEKDVEVFGPFADYDTSVTFGDAVESYFDALPPDARRIDTMHYTQATTPDISRWL